MADDQWTNFGEQVRAARTDMGLSYREAAARAGLSARTWIRIEQGNECTAGTLGKIGALLGWSPGVIEAILFGGETIENRLDRVEAQLAKVEEMVREAIKLLGEFASPELERLLALGEGSRPARSSARRG